MNLRHSKLRHSNLIVIKSVEVEKEKKQSVETSLNLKSKSTSRES